MEHPFSRVDRAYMFFLQRERDGLSFTLEDIQTATTYSEDTTKSYLSKKWSSFVVKREDGRYICQGLAQIPLEQFRDLHRQKRIVN